MHVRKAVITAAGRAMRYRLPGEQIPDAMIPIVDRDGITKSVLEVIAAEALDSGIEEICVIVAPGDEELFRRTFSVEGRPASSGNDPTGAQVQRLADLSRHLHFVVQPEPLGYGHAVWCARSFVGNEPFLLMISDHLYISGEARRCARQVLDLAEQNGCSVAAVQATREHLIHRFGTVAGKRLGGQASVFHIDTIIEKPTPSLAEQRLHVPGLRVGHYLCFFGMHVLTPTLFAILDEHIQQRQPERGRIELTPALQELAERERYLAIQATGRRYDIGSKYGLLEAQVAFAMSGVDRDEVLERLMELLLKLEQDRGMLPASPDTTDSHTSSPASAG